MIMVVIVTSIVAYKSLSKLTYIEYEVTQEEGDAQENEGEYVKLINPEEELSQDFKSPYDILYGVAIKINTFGSDNNSQYEFSIVDKASGEVLYEDSFGGSLIQDGSYHLLELKKNIRVETEKVYTIVITAEKVRDNSALGFYYGEQQDALYEFSVLDKSIEGRLCYSLYGGNVDYWWLGYTILIGVLVMLAIARAHIVCKKGIKIWEDKFFMSMMVFFVTVLLMNSFSVSTIFTDENDNLRGGMIIANGGVLYRDYVAQHTPVAYYLCAIFAFLGAGSVAQFRLSYYMFMALVFALLYYRHNGYFGRKKMALLPVLMCIFITSIISPQGYQVLSDGIQGLCMITLLLEFLRYYKDKKLDWLRCIIISICVWGSFGSAFVSAYAIIWIVLVVLGIEIYDGIKNKIKFKGIVARYYKLLICVIVPLIAAIIYFEANDSLYIAFEQFYLFNREVYPYYSAIGDNLLYPIFNAVFYFFSLVADNFALIVAAKATNIDILELIIVAMAIIILTTLFAKKRYVEACLLFAVMCCSATRGYNFHGIAAWYIVIMVIVMFYDEFIALYNPKICMPLISLVFVYMIGVYAMRVCDNLIYEEQPVSDIESMIVYETEPNEGIIIDAYCCDSIYLLYKDRYPLNRAVYMLPWYMDWYEEWVVDDLDKYMPEIVVYNELQSVWGYTYYANVFLEELNANYTRYSDNPEDGWKYLVWKRND